MEGMTKPISCAYCLLKITIRSISLPPLDSSTSGIKLYPISISIGSTFNKEYTKEERPIAVDKMIDLAVYLNANRLRLTELKKVEKEEFIIADEFFEKNHPFIGRSSNDLITKGCTYYYEKKGIMVSVKRLCNFAKGKDAPAFSCCFINTAGQKKIDVDTKDTFKVIYSDALVTDDWIFDSKKLD